MFAVPQVFLPLVFLGIYKKQTWAVWAVRTARVLSNLDDYVSIADVLTVTHTHTHTLLQLAPLSILGVVVTFGLMVLDANSVRVGADWCANGEKPWSQSQITCQFTAFISMTFVCIFYESLGSRWSNSSWLCS